MHADPHFDLSIAWERGVGRQITGRAALHDVLSGGPHGDYPSGATRPQCAILDLVGDLRARGSKVIRADYDTAPRHAAADCKAPDQVLETRLGRMARSDAGVGLVEMDNVFRSDDLSLFASDRIHPSEKGSACASELVAPLLDAEM